MSSYTITYEMRKGSASASNSKTVTADSESTAIRIVEDQAKAQRPDYDFILKGVKKK